MSPRTRTDAQARIRAAAEAAHWTVPVQESWIETYRRSRDIYVTVQYDTRGRVVDATRADTTGARFTLAPDKAGQVIAFIEKKAKRA